MLLFILVVTENTHEGCESDEEMWNSEPFLSVPGKKAVPLLFYSFPVDLKPECLFKVPHKLL